MKMNSIIKNSFLLIIITGLFGGDVIAQDQEQPQSKSEVTITLSYFKKAGTNRSALALVKAKNSEGKFVSAQNVNVDFYAVHKGELQLINRINTDNKGQAVIRLQKDMPLDDSLYFTIVAKIENDKLYEDAEEKVRYKDAILAIDLRQQDTVNVAYARVTEINKDGKEIPVNETEIKIYVQRLFGMMPAAEEYSITTDGNGEASFAFPQNIPGDTAGRLTLAARMEDNEFFGNVENKINALWGTVLVKETDPFPRALWEPNAPIPLVITISTLFGGVWCVYILIFYQMHKINKEGKEKTEIT